jgi:hypothetical protein
MKELLLIGGSHQMPILEYIKEQNYLDHISPSGFKVKLVMCSDLDFTDLVRVDSNLNIRCDSFNVLAESCIAAYNEPIIRYNPERIICLTLGSSHWAMDDPFWQTHYPAEIEPDLNQTIPVSMNELINRTCLNIVPRLTALVNIFLRPQFNIFWNICHPVNFFSLGASNGTPERTVKYIDLLYHSLYVKAAQNLGVKYIDAYSKVLGKDSFLRFEYCMKFADLHTNIKYGQFIWNEIMHLLNSCNWNITHFTPDTNKIRKLRS